MKTNELVQMARGLSLREVAFGVNPIAGCKDGTGACPYAIADR